MTLNQTNALITPIHTTVKKVDITISQPKVCCVSDIHVGVHQNSSLWHDTTLTWGEWLRDELYKNNINDIIISGDLFHYRDEIAVNTIHIVNELLKLWKKFNIIILAGNHDSFYKDRVDVNSLSILNGWSNITVIDKPTIMRCFNRDIMFCPWGTSDKELQSCDIMFGHFEITSFKMNHFKTCTEGISSKQLLKYCDQVITGHFHHRDEREYDEGNILYLGNPFQMDFGDAGTDKGYYILDIPEKKYQFTQNNISPKHHKIKLSELANTGRITSKYKNKIKNNIVRLYIDLHIMSDEIEFILKELFNHDPKILTVEHTINFDNFGLDENVECDLSGVDIPTAIEEFISMLDIENSKEVLQYTLDLYKTSK